jgi:predicted ATPase
MNNFKYKCKLTDVSSKKESFSAFERYEFIFFCDNIETPIISTNLSPGEYLQCYLYLWDLLKIKNKGVILMDEFDAHIHPPMIEEVMSILKDQFVNKRKFQVILTTHNPITISFPPEKCIFVMQSPNGDKTETPIIKSVDKKSDAIKLLTSNVVYVNEPYSFVV